METVDEVPPTAMPVRAPGSDAENFIAFPVTDVVEWYTRRSNGEIVRERFVSDDPEHPEDIPVGLDETTSPEAPV